MLRSRLMYNKFNKQSLPILTAMESDYMLSNNDESITYGDNGGILNPYARMGPNQKEALIPTVINEVTSVQTANVLSPDARLNMEVQSQIEEFQIFGYKTNTRSVIGIILIIGGLYFIPRLRYKL